MIKCDINSKKHSMCAIKLAVVAFVFIVMNLWTGLANWVQATNVWWFVGAFVILVLAAGGSGCCGGKTEMKPEKKVAKKKKK